MKSNFDFLQTAFPILAQIGSTAEKYVYSDANSALIKLGMFGETVVNLMLKLDKLDQPEFDNTHANRIRLLKRNGLIPSDIGEILYALRTTRNDAIHANFEDKDKCKTLLQMSYTLAVWFMQTYGDWNYTAHPFILPQEDNTDYAVLLQEKENLIIQLAAKVEETQSQNVSPFERIKRGTSAASLIALSEKETRYLIDEQLRRVGWEADTANLRYSGGIRPQKGRNIAIAEWPTNSAVSAHGYADYVLFVGLQMVGVIEAKKGLVDIPSIIDYQCKDYAKNIRSQDAQYIVSSWGKYKIPFVFATNGRKYLKQLETKSGIWWLDLRDKANTPKAQQGWVSPAGMMELLAKDILAANEKLKETSFDVLRDKSGLSLRDYQITAIEKAEEAIISGKRTALLSMATGTGKTRTAIGLMYRMIHSGRMNRILFLVDRNALGEQAQDNFEEYKIEDFMTLNNLYDIKTLDDKEIDAETKIHVATVQSFVKRILYSEGDTIPSVTDYDLIIVDEAHRGYILDKELDDDELLYRNQEDYISKYRTVIEYFDAVKIALTATPALHTTEIFGKPVFNYTYREAVIEGYLVDHDAPHTIVTQLSRDGISYAKGETLAIYDPITGEITNSDELQDELNFDVDTFNRKVITESFNRTVLTEIAERINPDGNGKTLIYAANDNHADLIVKLLREIYEPYGIDNDAIMKITGKTGDKKRIKEAIRLFKNEKYPNIVVTVDLLTTGVDVPAICNLVFLRRVKSRILFEQMLGRATRLCPPISKGFFEIYDPVGVYESLQDVSTMKPVVADPNATFCDLINGLSAFEDNAKVRNQINVLMAKLQRKKRNLSKKAVEQFRDLTDMLTPEQFIEKISTMPPAEAKSYVIAHRTSFNFLWEYNPTKMVVSDKEDTLLEHTRGYGNGQKPQDYLDEFRAFITENEDKIEALKLVCTRPTALTREALKSLRLELDRNGFTETQLNSAWKSAKNEDIAADIISFIRAQATGSGLLGHNERIQRAVAKLKKAHSFSKMELDWLDNIEAFLLTETILNEETFNLGAFRDKGGFVRIDKIFKNKLKDIIVELNRYLYDDGGNAA